MCQFQLQLLSKVVSTIQMPSPEDEPVYSSETCPHNPKEKHYIHGLKFYYAEIMEYNISHATSIGHFISL